MTIYYKDDIGVVKLMGVSYNERKSIALSIMSPIEINNYLNVDCRPIGELATILKYPIYQMLYPLLNELGISQTKEAKKKCRELYYNVDAWRENTKKSLNKKYGNDINNISQVKEVKAKKKKTFEENYGPGLLLANENFKKKAELVNAEKYGYSNPFNNPEIQKQILNNVGKKYNRSDITNVSQIPEIREKVNKTNLEKFGNICNLNSPETIHKRYCDIVDTYNTSEPTKSILKDRVKFIEFLQAYNSLPTLMTISTDLVLDYANIYNAISRYNAFDYVIVEKYNGVSIGEKLFADRITEITGLTWETSNRLVLNGLEIDLYCPDIKIGIEFNGTYWHSDIFQTKKYHENKSNIASTAGIRLIHVYEYEWASPEMRVKIESLIKIACGCVNTRIYARNCEVRKITNREAAPFNNKNHLQSHRDAKITYGLYFENELVQLMSFSKNKKYEWEIIRGCPGSNNIVIGGVNKLFKAFIREYNPKEIFSYCDFNKFDGRSYSSIGMKYIGLTGPDKTWIIKGEAFKRSARKYQEYKQAASYCIWGAGSKKFLWTKPK